MILFGYLVLFLFFLILILYSIYFKDFVCSSFSILYVSFNYLGGLYYALGGDAYTVPSSESLKFLLFLHSSVFFGVIFFLLFSPVSKFRSQYNYRYILNEVNFYNQSKYILLFLACLPVIYIFIFHNQFAFYKMLVGAVVSERDRPDITGGIPRYYSFTVWISSVSLPLLVTFIRSSRERVNFKIFSLFMLVFFSLAIGSKSGLMMIAVYTFFTSDLGFRDKVKVSIALVSFLTVFYVGMKIAYNPHLLERGNELYYLMADSLFRRVFVINSAIQGFVVDYFFLESGEIPEGFSHHKQFVFYSIYGYLPGGAPIPFSVELLMKSKNLIYAMIFNVAFIYIWFYFIYASLNNSHPYVSEVIRFLSFYGFVVSTAGFVDDIVIRSIVPILFFVVLSKLRIKNIFSKRFF